MYQVSILVPIYGVEKYIERCARSLFEQTYENLEYIFVDDCTPDKSIEILKRVIEDYPNRKNQVRIIRHEHNRGLAAARNTALDAATGPFISHVDSDDYLSLDAIQLLVAKQVETDADIVTGNYYQLLPDGIKEIDELLPKGKNEILMEILTACSNLHNVCRKLIRLSLYNDYHIRTREGVNFREDYQQSAQLFYYAKIVAKVNDFVYYYDRTNDSSYVSLNTSISNLHIELWQQSIESAIIVENFYADKEPVYYKTARLATLLMIKYQMSAAARFRKKQYFEKLKKLIMTEYATYYTEIGWKNSIIRTFMYNYSLNSIYRRTFAHCQQVVALLRVK